MLQVLDLLTSQMSGASTLGQMRVARDALMQHEDPNKTHLASSHISLLDAGGVELEVVRAGLGQGIGSAPRRLRSCGSGFSVPRSAAFCLLLEECRAAPYTT